MQIGKKVFRVWVEGETDFVPENARDFEASDADEARRLASEFIANKDRGPGRIDELPEGSLHRYRVEVRFGEGNLVTEREAQSGREVEKIARVEIDNGDTPIPPELSQLAMVQVAVPLS